MHEVGKSVTMQVLTAHLHGNIQKTMLRVFGTLSESPLAFRTIVKGNARNVVGLAAHPHDNHK